MSISEDLNAGAFGAEMSSSNQFGTDGRSLQLDETLLGENNVEKVLGTLVDGLNFEADESTSKVVDDGAPDWLKWNLGREKFSQQNAG